MIKEYTKLNELTMKTNTWLNVNEFNLGEIKIPKINKYKKSVIDEIDNDRITIFYGDKNRKDYISEEYNDVKITGVSRDNTEFIKEHSNKQVTIISKDTEKTLETQVLKYTLDDNSPCLIDDNLIIVEENSSLDVVMEYKSEDDTYNIHNGMTRIYAKNNSNLSLTIIQDLNSISNNFNSIAVYVGNNAVVKLKIIEIGSRATVINCFSELQDEGSDVDLKTIYVGGKDEKLDISYNVLHKSKFTKSNIDARGVLKENSEKTFKGIIDFKKGAIGSKGSESENVLLLSENAISKSVPLLLCGEDDVNGEHAVTVGKIDQNKLFYLMNRGFSKEEAEIMLIEASFTSVINEIPSDEIREKIIKNIRERLV